MGQKLHAQTTHASYGEGVLSPRDVGQRDDLADVLVLELAPSHLYSVRIVVKGWIAYEKSTPGGH